MHPGLLQATQTGLDRSLQLPLILYFYSGTSIVILIFILDLCFFFVSFATIFPLRALIFLCLLSLNSENLIASNSPTGYEPKCSEVLTNFIAFHILFQ